jgi:uridine kinase
MNRRNFLALASGLLVPVPEPVKAYFFAPVLMATDEETDAELRARVRRKWSEMGLDYDRCLDAYRRALEEGFVSRARAKSLLQGGAA